MIFLLSSAGWKEGVGNQDDPFFGTLKWSIPQYDDISEGHSSRQPFWSVYTSIGYEPFRYTRRIMVRWYCVSSDFLCATRCVPEGSPVQFPSNTSFFRTLWLSLVLIDLQTYIHLQRKFNNPKIPKSKIQQLNSHEKPVSNIPKPRAEWPIYAKRYSQ